MDAVDSNWVRFKQTHWSVVRSAKRAQSAERDAALDALCRCYWRPLYAYIRQRGFAPEDAQDLTQEFFARMLEKEFLQHATQTKGKFRSFLLGCVNHLLGDQRDKRRAKKRGGDRTHLSMEDFQAAEAELVLERGSPDGGELVYDRVWAQTVLRRANDRLEEEYRARGKSELFAALKAFAPGSEQQADYASLAAKLGLREDALRAAVHRMRRRFGELVREEVGQTVADAGELEAEIRHLIRVVSVV